MDASRREVGAQLTSEVPGADVVGSDDHDRAFAKGRFVLGERGDQIRLNRSGGVHRALVRVEGSAKRRVVAVVVGKLQGGPKRHSGQASEGLNPLYFGCLPFESSDELPMSSAWRAVMTCLPLIFLSGLNFHVPSFLTFLVPRSFLRPDGTSFLSDRER